MIATILPEGKDDRAPACDGPAVSLVSVVNEAFIKHQLRALNAAGVTTLTIPSDNSELRKYCRSHYSEGVDISFETGAPSGPVLVLACDALPGRELRSFVEFHARSSASLTIAVALPDRRPIGIYAVSPEAPEYSDISLLNNVGRGRGNANADTFPLTDDSVRIETVADYLAATRILLAKLMENGHGLRRITDTVWTDDLVFIAPTARITGNVLLGRNCSVGPGATVTGPVVLGEGTMVCRNACVKNSVIWAGAAVGAGARVIDSLVTECFTIGPGAALEHCVGIDIDSDTPFPFQPASHTIEYSPRGLATGAS